MRRWVSRGSVQSDNGRSSSICLSGIQGSEPDCMTRLVPELRSTSHTVAARDGCTNIPLAAGRAQKDENHSRKRRFRPWPAPVRRSGSVRTNPVLGITGLARGLSSCGLHRSTFDDDAGGHIFPESDKQLSRQRHDRRFAQAAAVALYAAVEPESERRVRLMPQPAAPSNVDPNEDDRGPVPAIPTHPASVRPRRRRVQSSAPRPSCDSAMSSRSVRSCSSVRRERS